MKASNKREKIKLSQKYSEMNFWKSSLEDIKDLFHAYDIELSDFLQQLEFAVGESVKSPTEETSIINREEKEDPQAKLENPQSCKESFEEKEREVYNNSAPSWMKKAFKAIAIKTHPDKVLFRDDLSESQKEDLVKKYAAAADAIASSSGIALLEISKSLDIELDLSPKEQIDMLENKIKKIKSEINDHKAMVSWSWGESEGDLSTRTNLIVYVRSYLKKPVLNASTIKTLIEKYENGETLFEKNNKRDKILKRKVGTHPHPSIGKMRKK